MEQINCNLKILPISDFQPHTIQKCLIPKELYPSTCFPGSIVKCFNSSGGQFICRLFSMDNQYPRRYCYLDTTVGITSNEIALSPSLTKITPLELDGDEIKIISVKVTINVTIFHIKSNMNIAFLEEIIQDILEPFILANDSVVLMDEFGTSLGLEKIHVKADSLNTFKIGQNTQIVIENVNINEVNALKYSALPGLEYEIQELNRFMSDLQLHKKSQSSLKLSQNVLLIGPTGSGKTSICHNFLIENKCNNFRIQCLDIMGQFPGETENILRKIFQNAKMFVDIFKPKDMTVIYVEDLDLICPIVHDSSDTGHQRRISTQFINSLDELYTKFSNIIVLATTSNIDTISGSLRRPGRFDKEISISALTKNGRQKVLQTYLKSPPFLDIDCSCVIEFVAERTPGFVGGDIQQLHQNVIQNCVRQKLELKIDEVILQDLFEAALTTVIPASIRGSDVSISKSNFTFDNIGGMENLKKILKISVLDGLKHSEAYIRFGLHIPKGILLYGPPGCSKTTVAKCLANEANMTFISTSGAEVYSPYVGCAEKFISKIFDTARKNTPCLIFLDEIDTLVGKRTVDSKSDVQIRILSTLLTEMDGIGVKMNVPTAIAQNNILVVAATNRPDMIDDALMRPGRFDKLIHVPAPDFTSRLAILKIFSKKMPFSDTVDLNRIADKTENFSGADLCNLCNEAALHAFTQNFGATQIHIDDFTYILDRVKSSLSPDQINSYYKFEKRYLL